LGITTWYLLETVTVATNHSSIDAVAVRRWEY
jgi:hypothetical protein